MVWNVQAACISRKYVMPVLYDLWTILPIWFIFRSTPTLPFVLIQFSQHHAVWDPYNMTINEKTLPTIPFQAALLCLITVLRLVIKKILHLLFLQQLLSDKAVTKLWHIMPTIMTLQQQQSVVESCFRASGSQQINVAWQLNQYKQDLPLENLTTLSCP